MEINIGRSGDINNIDGLELYFYNDEKMASIKLYNFDFLPYLQKEIYNILGIVPEFISTYNARKFAWPELVQENDKKKFVLFGGLPKDVDKKMIIWEKVAKREPQITWQYTRNNTLKKENFDQTDAYTCVLGFMKLKEIWK